MTDQELLARLILCEAGGEGEVGMKAVASVVMNRVNEDRGEYGSYSSIRDVILQSGQFVCAMTSVGGKINPQNIYNMRPTAIHYDIANWAIAGNRVSNLGEALWFYAPFSNSCKPKFPTYEGQFVIKIGDHCFYNATPEYYIT